MVGRGRRHGSSRGVPKDRRVGGGRGFSVVTRKSGGEGTIVVDKEVLSNQVLSSSHLGENHAPLSPGTVDRNFRLTENEEQIQVADSFVEIRTRDSGTAESIDKVTGENLGPANGELDGGCENEEALGLQRLIMRAASAGGSQLSAAELEHNKQQQEDEVLALQSIYGFDHVSMNEGGGGPIAFMINVPVDFQETLQIVAEAPRSSESKDENMVASTSGSTSSHDNRHSFTVEALPPISLLCVLPPTYPSHSAPLFTLTCLWLNSKKLSSLCACLDKAWEDTSPEVVVYSWVEWLKSQSLSHLGATERLELGPYIEKGRGKSIREEYDERAISASVSFDVDIPRLLRFNEEIRNKEYLEALHMCCICLSEQLGRSFARLPCQHMFCWTCMQQYCNMHVKEGSVISLICPDTSCKESVPPGLLKELLGKEAFERWEDLLLQKTLDSMADVVYCPRCENAGIEDADHLVQCSKCFFSFCSLCMSSWHAGQDCMTAEAKLRILQGRQKGRAMGEAALKKEKELINEVLNMKYINKEAKQCPTCKIAVQKSEGCNKMTCTNCGGYFCFKCGRSITGYEHFRDASKCVLFDQEEIDRWEHQMNLQQLQIQNHQQQQGLNRVGGLAANAIRPCPNCRQLNLKEGNNNHMFCWACQNHYCALCNKMVRRSAEHFGPNKCRQHTAD